MTRSPINSPSTEPVPANSLILDAEGKVLKAGSYACQLLSLTPAAICGRMLEDILKGNTATVVPQWLNMVKIGTHSPLHASCRTPDGPLAVVATGTFSETQQRFRCMLSADTYSQDDSLAFLWPDQPGFTEDAELTDIIDKDLFQTLMDDFYALTGIPVGIIDIKGRILVAEGWQDICTKFHRVHPEACAHCQSSDYELTEGIRPGEFRAYKCLNNLWDIATPIYIGDQRKGHIFLGQFFYDDEPVDMALFRNQARKYGFDEEEYLAALLKVPRFSHEAVNHAMRFYARLASLISRLSYTNMLLESTITGLQDKVAFEQALLDAIPSPIFYKNLQKIYLGGNAAFTAYTGLTPDRYVGKTVYDISTRDLAEVYDHADTALLETGIPQKYETSVVYADSTSHEVIFNKATYSDASGNPAGIIGVITDITERKHAEDMIRNAHSELERKVEERTTELAAANQELIAMNDELLTAMEKLRSAQQHLLQSEKMAALGSLVAGISHEISTPLGISVTSVSYVQREMDDLLRKYRSSTITRGVFEAFLDESVSMLQTASTNLVRADLLLKSFKQISVDQTHDDWRRFNARDYLEDLLASLHPLLKTCRCKVTVECSDTLEISGYPGVLAQIVTNLVTNAVRHAFTPESESEIRVRLFKDGDTNQLEFSDNGIGMTPDVRRHVFEPFYTTKRGTGGGTGLGLHLVYNLAVQRLGGTIELSTSKEHGTRFVIRFDDISADQLDCSTE